jgi:hypothetical protein
MMKTRKNKKGFVSVAIPAAIFALLPSVPAHAAAGGAAPLFGARACTSSESWSFTGAVFESKRATFKSAVNGGLAPVRGFSEGLAMRRFAANDETKTLGEYMISRSLYDGKLQHIAFNGFAQIAGRPVRPELAGVQLSAVGCMVEIRDQFPAMTLPQPVVDNLPEFAKRAVTPEMREVLYRASLDALQARLFDKPMVRKGQGDEKVVALASLLQGGGLYEDFGFALRAAHVGDHNTAITRFEKFLTSTAIPAHLKRYINTAHILMARELYAMKQFDRAATHLKLVTKSSNDLAIALEELAWSLLMDDKLTEAIGTAMNLQAGGLRKTYAPEAPMVMAMALNELCQYPESVRSINAFRKNYEKVFRWLDANASRDGLYKDAIQYVKRSPASTVPDRVASEWVRSPLFIASQDELNLLFDEQESTVALGKSGAREQAKIADALLLRAKPLPERLNAFKKKAKDGEGLPPLLKADLLALKEMIIGYRRLQQGAPVWHTILGNYKKVAKSTEKKLVDDVNSDLRNRSQRMRGQLEEIAENIQLIEVEIYNGASQDIIWQNAHPEYKKIAQKLKDEQKREATAKSYDWGRAPASLDEEGGEVWEDELGSFAANLFDNCSSKDRYLALRAGR